MRGGGGDQQTFSVKNHIVNVLGFVSVAQLPNSTVVAKNPPAIDNMHTNEHCCVLIKLYSQKQIVGQLILNV